MQVSNFTIAAILQFYNYAWFVGWLLTFCQRGRDYKFLIEFQPRGRTQSEPRRTEDDILGDHDQSQLFVY